MGIYGALSTAVTGLRAQSFALENISGNIANSQTTGFKRVDTSFLDLIPDAPSKSQTSGSVLAQSLATNTTQGDVKSVSNPTYMAVNGSGFFVVEPALGQSDGQAVFGGSNFYTRRGDFDIDKSGYLVNGSGYYLKGLPIDPATGNISSSQPEVLRVSNSFLPAAPTSRINYQLNLPQLPTTYNYQQSKTAGSELMKASHFINIPTDTAAQVTGTATTAEAKGTTTAFTDGAAVTGTDAASTLATTGQTLTIKIGSTTKTYTFATTGGTNMATGTIDTSDTAGGTDTVAGVLSKISADLPAGSSVSLVDGKIRVASGNTTDSITITDGTTGFGLANGTTAPALAGGDLATRLAKNGDTLAVTIGGVTRTYNFSNTGSSSGTAISTADPSTNTVDKVLAYIQQDLTSNGVAGATVSLKDGQVDIKAGNTTDGVTIADNTVGFGTGNAAVTAGLASGDDATRLASAGQTLEIKVGTADRTYTFAMGGGTSGTTIDLTDPSTSSVGQIMSYIQTDLQGHGATGATVALNNGTVQIKGGNTNDSVAVTNGTSGFGLAAGATTGNPTVSTTAEQAARVDTISAADSDDFINQSISGGAVTVYASNGAPADMQMRWAKVSSAASGGQDTWNLFYLTNGAATGSQPMWKNVGTDFTFGADSSLNPPITELNLNGAVVDGVQLGSMKMEFGTNGITQFDDPNGTAGVTERSQNGYAAGQYVSVAINDSGRVVVSYDNGQTVDIAQVVTANFNAANQLKRMDGGIFAATADSGEPIYDDNGGVIGSSLESSNTDISEEFTKLIVTQQAYAAGTKIVSAADDMLQQALNMIR
jgi:flagellar hook protein FlgE